MILFAANVQVAVPVESVTLVVEVGSSVKESPYARTSTEAPDSGGDVIKLFPASYNRTVIAFGMFSVVEDVVIEGTIWLSISKYLGRPTTVVNADIAEPKDAENRNLYVASASFTPLDAAG